MQALLCVEKNGHCGHLSVTGSYFFGTASHIAGPNKWAWVVSNMGYRLIAVV